jgi:hypothetical protein
LSVSHLIKRLEIALHVSIHRHKFLILFWELKIMSHFFSFFFLLVCLKITFYTSMPGFRDFRLDKNTELVLFVQGTTQQHTRKHFGSGSHIHLIFFRYCWDLKKWKRSKIVKRRMCKEGNKWEMKGGKKGGVKSFRCVCIMQKKRI